MEISDIVQKVLLGEMFATTAMEKIRSIMKESSQKEYSQFSHAYRLCRSLKDIKIRQNSWYDVCGHLRQTILFLNTTFFIDETMYKNIKNISHIFKLTFIRGKNGLYEVDVLNIMPSWFGDFDQLKSLYRLEKFRQVKKVLGDGYLYNFTGYKTYRSSTQKIMINAAMNMPEGSTLLGCMPTGEGKSLVGLMPQYYDKKGTTIVIVPTVALAIDQSINAQYYYRNMDNKPIAYHSGLNLSEKKRIYEKLKNGEIPIIYISPEAVFNSRIGNILLDSAKRGYINRIVIDEAHIVNDWGSQFRTEFQLLSAYRKKLLLASNNKLKTILLSATFTDNIVEMLKELFSEEGKYIEIRGDALRPEIQYYVDKSKTLKERLTKIKEILPLLPRPIILYVIKPEDAEKWKRDIFNFGFNSIDTFTGDIVNRQEREQLIDRWNKDDIDIMVATSAFGMGIDKKDIRTVIHCCIPESINRFYQEVGRGGRDGFPSLSLLFVMPSHDMEDTKYFVNGKVMTIEKLVQRWDTMRKNHMERISGNSIWINTNVKPSYLKGISGRLNANWNEYVLLLLYRKKFLDIKDVRFNPNTFTKDILVTIKDSILNDMEKLKKMLEDIRKEEIDIINSEFDQMKKLINSDGQKRCFAHYFQKIYNLVEPACGGCPGCRANSNPPYSKLNYTEYYAGREMIGRDIYNDSGVLMSSLNVKDEILLLYREDNFIKDNMEKLINMLCENNVNFIIIPDDYQLRNLDFDKLTVYNERFYNLITINEIEDDYSEYILYGLIAIIYPTDVKKVNKYFKLREKYLKKNIRIINISQKGMKLNNNIYLEDKINGSIRYIEVSGGKVNVL